MDKKIIQLKITLKGVKPAVWRRVQVEADTSMRKLHEILNLAMGWQLSHLHQFVVGKKTIGNSELDEIGDMVCDKKVKLADVIKSTHSFQYEYDFGDGWIHTVAVEDIAEVNPKEKYPLCIAGKGACPPEDVGGVHGFENFKEVMENPKHPEHKETKTWYGNAWDADAFDYRSVNKRQEFKSKKLVAVYE